MSVPPSISVTALPDQAGLMVMSTGRVEDQQHRLKMLTACLSEMLHAFQRCRLHAFHLCHPTLGGVVICLVPLALAAAALNGAPLRFTEPLLLTHLKCMM